MTADTGVLEPHAEPGVLELKAGDLRLALRTDLGAAIAGLWRAGVPVLYSVEPGELAGSRRSGGFVMAPYSNRLGYRRFRFFGHDYQTAPNFPDEPHSLHGVAWQRAWTVVSSRATSAEGAAGSATAELVYEHQPDEHWPFAFRVQQRLTLEPGALAIDLTLTNTDSRAAPAGLGWHPYFPKRQRSRLHVELTDRWERDETTRLPTRRVAQPGGIDADVGHLAFDHCFEGWRGAARIRDEKHSLKLTASVPYMVVYTPGDLPFFAVEPVSHVNNAIHMAEPAAHGLRTLQPGQAIDMSVRLDIAGV